MSATREVKLLDGWHLTLIGVRSAPLKNCLTLMLLDARAAGATLIRVELAGVVSHIRARGHNFFATEPSAWFTRESVSPPN
jgi:hypothetical protein